MTLPAAYRHSVSRRLISGLIRLLQTSIELTTRPTLFFSLDTLLWKVLSGSLYAVFGHDCIHRNADRQRGVGLIYDSMVLALLDLILDATYDLFLSWITPNHDAIALASGRRLRLGQTCTVKTQPRDMWLTDGADGYHLPRCTTANAQYDETNSKDSSKHDYTPKYIFNT